jgi:hypothetical protein
VFSRVAPRVVAPVRSPRRAVWGGARYSIVASAQQCPASSRATATTTIVRGLPRASSACQRPYSRRALRSAWACTAAGLPFRLRSSVTLKREGRRWCQAASIKSRRAWLLPALVMPPCRRLSPLEFSLGSGRGTGRATRDETYSTPRPRHSGATAMLISPYPCLLGSTLPKATISVPRTATIVPSSVQLAAAPRHRQAAPWQSHPVPRRPRRTRAPSDVGLLHARDELGSLRRPRADPSTPSHLA